MGLEILDFIIILSYFVLVLIVGFMLSNKARKNLDQYFMPLSLSGSQKNNFIDFSMLSLFEKSLIDLIIEIFNRKIPFRRME